MHGFHTGVRPIIFTAVFYHAPRWENSWKTFVFNADPRIAFVVFKHHVVARLIVFYQIVLQQKRIGLSFYNDVLYGLNFLHQKACSVVVKVFCEIGSNAFFEVFGLAHVEQFSFFIVILVNTRRIGKGRNLKSYRSIGHRLKDTLCFVFSGIFTQSKIVKKRLIEDFKKFKLLNLAHLFKTKPKKNLKANYTL